MSYNNRPVILTHLINIIVSLTQGLLGLRILLKLLGANASAPFVRWVYDSTQSLLSPFQGMFPAPRIEGFFVLEFSTLFAIIAYSFIGYLLIEVISVFEAGNRSSKKE